MDAMIEARLTAGPDSLELDVSDMYRCHGTFITRCIERLSGRGAHVEDLLQETFVTAYQKRRIFDPERANPRTWLYGIAANMCRTHQRGLRRFVTFAARWSAEPESAASRSQQPDAELDRRQRAHLVGQLLQKLSFKQREVFVLYELEDLDGESIAQMLDIPLGTVWTRLHHARRSFRHLAEKRLQKEESR